jgi:Predicted periplasmic lipoprotein (DUF2279)
MVLLFSTAIYGMVMLALGYAWYAPQWISSFHFFDDLGEWQQMDKIAHFFWAFQVSALATRLLQWATMDEARAARTGAILGFLFVSGIEVADGFSTAYGASVFDVAANALGASAFLGQRVIWKKILVWPKFSFHPTMFAPLRPDVLGTGFLEEVLKDYNGQTFWYSFRIPKLPLPAWLTLAVGVGAEGMIFGRMGENEAMDLHPHRRYFLSIDIDLSHIQTSSKLLKALLYIPNIIKLPAPALEISAQGIRFHPIYF